MQESLFARDAGFILKLYHEKILTQESNLTIFKHTLLLNTPSAPIVNHANFLKHDKHAIS